MLLAIDIGNTTTHFGVAPNLDAPWTATLGFSSERQRPADEWFSLLHPHLELAGPWDETWRVVVASVVPAITDAIATMASRYLKSTPLVYAPQLELGIEIATAHPAETGADRVVNAAIAYARYGGPVIVVDMGTATKVDYVDRDGRFLGGSIAAGIGLSMETLAGKAARLYAMPLTVPDRTVGRDTVAALQSGIVLGHLAMIDGLIARFRQEQGPIDHIILTGGYSPILAEALQHETVHDPLLTLEGLRLLASLNPPVPM